MANVNHGDGTWSIDIMGGCAFVVDPQKPHLGGNMFGGDAAADFTKDLWPWMIKKWNIKSILDVGCGEGHALKGFRNLGVEKLRGIEGLWQNAEKADPIDVFVQDLTLGPCMTAGFDWVWCHDVAEHIEERYVGNLLNTLACGKFLAMCQGGPENHSTGWHHVNNKPESYWIEQLAAVGFVTDEAATQESRRVTNTGLWPTFGRIYVMESK